MANRRSARNATAATSKKSKTAPKATATKKAIKNEPSPELGGSDNGDPDDQDDSVIYELETKNGCMVRKVQCTMENGDVATLGTKKNYTQTVELSSMKPFSLEPVLMTTGPYSGRHVLVLQPEPTTNEKFPFLKLPAEIRNMIYSSVLERPGCSILIRGKHSGVIDPLWRGMPGGGYAMRQTDPYSTSLMRVNKQINIESTPYLFSRHKFEFPDTTMMQRFLEYIGPERVKSLVSVSVDKQYSTTMRRAYKLLAPATSLENLELSNCHWRNYYRQVYITDWHVFLLPLVKAMCLEGRSREDVVGIISISDGISGSCATHGRFTVWSKKNCEKAEKAFEDYYKKLRRDTYKAMDEAEAKKKAIKNGTPVKTRAGRKTKAVDYADDDSDNDYKG